MSLSKVPYRGPMRLDAEQAAKIQPGSIERYRIAGKPFVAWMISERLDPETSEEWDDLLVEWKSARHPSKTQFEQAVASVEFFFPRWRGSLSWAKAVCAGWSISHVPRHTVPCGKGFTALLGAHVAEWDHRRLGAGMQVQCRLGLRPSELLGLKKDFIESVKTIAMEGNMAPLIPAQRRAGTKSGHSGLE